MIYADASSNRDNDTRPTPEATEPDLNGEVNSRTTRAIINILEDFSEERSRLNGTERAILNILEDFSAEKNRLEATQKAILNILDDFDEEKSKVERVNVELRREIAERAVAETNLTKRTMELGRSNAELEQFAYVASHDLQEPLRMVSSYVQLLQRRYEGQLDARADKYIAYAVEGATRMQALIAALLEYSRSGRQEVQTVEVDTNLCLRNALLNLKSAVNESRGHIESSPLPNVMADTYQVTQVFQNLLANALKFHRPGTAPQVSITCQSGSTAHVFRVRDNGIGIEPRYAERIFVIFQRLHTRNQYSGTGIGLSICKRVIERHGGRIWVEPHDGDDGTSFCFSLPAPENHV